MGCLEGHLFFKNVRTLGEDSTGGLDVEKGANVAKVPRGGVAAIGMKDFFQNRALKIVVTRGRELHTITVSQGADQGFIPLGIAKFPGQFQP